MGRKKLPNDPRRKKQVSTFIKRYGRQGYQQAGSIGGKKSPTRFNSESAAAAARRGHELRRQRQAAEKANSENENGTSINETS